MSKMTPAQEEHAWDIVDDFSNRAFKKYEAGAKEHGGLIWELPLLTLIDEAKNEHIDGYVYTSTIERILKQLLADPVIAKRIKELMK